MLTHRHSTSQTKQRLINIRTASLHYFPHITYQILIFVCCYLMHVRTAPYPPPLYATEIFFHFQPHLISTGLQLFHHSASYLQWNSVFKYVVTPAPRDITPNRVKETRPMTTVLFRDFTHRTMVAYYICFSTTSRSNLQGSTWPLKTGPRGLPETWVRNYLCTVCNIPISRTARLADHPLNNRTRNPTSINHAC